MAAPRPTICRHRGEDGRSGRLADGLDPGSLLLLVVVRAWVSRHRAPDQPAPDWRQLLVLSEVSEPTVERLDRLLRQVRHGMRRPLDVRCCPCPRIGADEEALLRMIGALQAGDRLAALDELCDWLEPEAAARTLPDADAFARAFLAEGLPVAGAAVPAPPAGGAERAMRAH